VRSTQREAQVEINPRFSPMYFVTCFYILYSLVKGGNFVCLTFFYQVKLLANQLCHLFSGFYTYFFKNGQYSISLQKMQNNYISVNLQMIC